MSELEVKPERQSQVDGQTNNLQKNLSKLHDRIGTLTDRLSTVLRLSLPSESGEDKKEVELVALASTIQGSGNSVQLAVLKIEDLLDRLEL